MVSHCQDLNTWALCFTFTFIYSLLKYITQLKAMTKADKCVRFAGCLCYLFKWVQNASFRLFVENNKQFIYYLVLLHQQLGIEIFFVNTLCILWYLIDELGVVKHDSSMTPINWSDMHQIPFSTCYDCVQLFIGHFNLYYGFQNTKNTYADANLWVGIEPTLK